MPELTPEQLAEVRAMVRSARAEYDGLEAALKATGIELPDGPANNRMLGLDIDIRRLFAVLGLSEDDPS